MDGEIQGLKTLKNEGPERTNLRRLAGPLFHASFHQDFEHITRGESEALLVRFALTLFGH